MNAQTDLSKKIRHGLDHGLYLTDCRALLAQAAEEIERYYTGMLNWKASAERTSSASSAVVMSDEYEKGWVDGHSWKSSFDKPSSPLDATALEHARMDGWADYDESLAAACIQVGIPDAQYEALCIALEKLKDTTAAAQPEKPPSQQPVAPDLEKTIRSLAMLIAEEGIKEGRGLMQAVASDRVRAVVDGVLSWDIGRGLLQDLYAAAQAPAQAPDSRKTLLTIANDTRWACMKLYSPDDTATDWADKMAALDIGAIVDAAMSAAPLNKAGSEVGK